jgi:hypothetical protein
MIPEELAQEILKRKQDNDGEEYLISKILPPNIRGRFQF